MTPWHALRMDNACAIPRVNVLAHQMTALSSEQIVLGPSTPVNPHPTQTA
jgi:hypothetical protein